MQILVFIFVIIKSSASTVRKFYFGNINIKNDRTNIIKLVNLKYLGE